MQVTHRTHTASGHDLALVSFHEEKRNSENKIPACAKALAGTWGISEKQK